MIDETPVVPTEEVETPVEEVAPETTPEATPEVVE